MNTLTETQSQLISQLTQEFQRINSETKVNGKFNLVSAEELNQIAEEVRRNKAEAEADSNYWAKAARDEADRIVELLKEDLPMARVERYGKANQHYDLPDILIARKGDRLPHVSECVTIHVKVRKEYTDQTHGCWYYKGLRLVYEYYNTPDSSAEYESIEQLFEQSNVRNHIRERVLNN
jgi:hypothetical protein